MAAAAEERHAGIQQDGGDEGGIGNPTQAFNTALRAAWSKKNRRIYQKIIIAIRRKRVWIVIHL